MHVFALVLLLAQFRNQEYRARVVLDDGSPPPRSPLILPKRFGLCRIMDGFGNGNFRYMVASEPIASGERTPDDCEVTIRLAGYRKADVTLHDGAVIVLKRIGETAEGSTVSVTAMQAPEKARQAYQKGMAAMTEKKWPAAQKALEKAVALYPRYAQAWTALGEALREQAQAEEARTAWGRALDADPKFLKAYVDLARLAVDEGKNEDAVSVSERALGLNPVEFPAIYFYSASAHFRLGHLDVAGKNARRAIDLDSRHDIPAAEYLLGKILMAQGDAGGALEHMKRYLELAPDAPDKAEVRQSIAKLESAGSAK